jgi:small subunit ribosomal protein S4
VIEMGDPKFPRRLYKTPTHPWNAQRIQEEHQMVRKYGLKNKHELWRSKTMLSDLREQARKLQARLRTTDEQAVKEHDEMLGRLKGMGLLHGEATLNDVLVLDLEDLLSRRLQTQTYLKGLARTMRQARQFIVHGHIAISGRKVTIPGYIVPETETGAIGFYHSSDLGNDMHPERPSKDFTPQLVTVKEEMRAAADRERETKRARDDRVRAVARRLKPEGVETEDVDLATVAAGGEEPEGPMPEEEPEGEGDEGAPDAEKTDTAKATKPPEKADKAKAAKPPEKADKAKAARPSEKGAEGPSSPAGPAREGRPPREGKRPERKPKGGEQ